MSAGTLVLGEQKVLLSTETSLQPSFLYFKFVFFYGADDRAQVLVVGC